MPRTKSATVIVLDEHRLTFAKLLSRATVKQKEEMLRRMLEIVCGTQSEKTPQGPASQQEERS
jgi:hypothetical protein